MSGILDNKKRIMDTVLTQEGRRQLASGDFQIKFVSFTDGHTFYQGDEASGSADATGRIYLEASSLFQDQITFEADDSGKLRPFRSTRDVDVLSGKILSASNGSFLSVITGSAFASLSGELLSASLDNFRNLYTIASVDKAFDEEDDFQLNTRTAEFKITNKAPIPSTDLQSTTVDSIESLFQDEKLTHIHNFRYLPPVNKPTPLDPAGAPLGSYPRLGQGEIPTFDELSEELEGKDFRTVNFVRNSAEGNLVAQFFERQNTNLLKLDVIDFGSFLSSDPDRPEKRVFFVGKIFMDGFGAHTFVNIFTLIYD